MSFLCVLFISLSSFAKLQSIYIKNLNLDYKNPVGLGDVERFGVTIDKKRVEQKTQTPFEVIHQDNALKISMPIGEFNWLNPFRFIAYAKSIEAKEVNLQFKQGGSFFNAANLNFESDGGAAFSISQGEALCSGNSPQRDPIQRLLVDCIGKAQVRAKEVETPFSLIDSILADIPYYGPDESESLKDDLLLNIEKGLFAGHLKVKLAVKGTLRFKGAVELENGNSVIAVRVDQIKYGIFPVTSLVMNELKRRVKHPNISIDPPWIRFYVGKK